MASPTRASQITKQIGNEHLQLVQGKGYWYFVYDQEINGVLVYDTVSVPVLRLSHLSTEQWVAEGREFLASLSVRIESAMKYLPPGTYNATIESVTTNSKGGIEPVYKVTHPVTLLAVKVRGGEYFHKHNHKRIAAGIAKRAYVKVLKSELVKLQCRMKHTSVVTRRIIKLNKLIKMVG